MNQNELYHYGVLGMKWGVRRYQNKNGKLTNAGKKRYNDPKQNLESDKEDGLKGFHLTDKQKKYIKIGATAAATALVAYGGYKLYKSGKLDGLIKKGNEAVKGLDVDKTTGLKLSKDKNPTILKAIKDCNPTKSRTNCRACAINTVLKLMGYDTEALDIPGGSFAQAIEKCFKNAKIVPMTEPSKEKITRQLLRRYKEGDFGAIQSTFRIKGKEQAHAYNWKIENRQAKFFCGQKELDDFSEYLNLISKAKEAQFVRLNDLEIDPLGIKEFVKNRK